MSTLFERFYDQTREAYPDFPPLFYDGKGFGRGAVFSDDELHRLFLDRLFGLGETAVFVGVQPSRADHLFDDPTVCKLYGFGSRNGIGRWLLVNKTTLISPDVDTLARCAQPVHSDANVWIRRAFAAADRVVVGWGRLDKLPPDLRGRWREIVAMAADKPLWCFGTCQDGHPVHPARIPYSSALVRWSPPV